MHDVAAGQPENTFEVERAQRLQASTEFLKPGA